MNQQMTWLTYMTIVTALMWVPYILDSFLVRGIMGTLGNPQDSKKSLSPWAVRLKAAHYNSVENLVIVGLLVIIAEHSSIDVSSYMCIYFLARVAHYVVYGIGLMGLRTVLFLTGFVMQVMMFMSLI